MNKDILKSELQFKAVRSSGAGGQNVNKVASKVELIFDLEASLGLTDDEKELLKTSVNNRLTKENVLLLQCEESRSQHKNKTLVIKAFLRSLKKDYLSRKGENPQELLVQSLKKD